MSVLGQGQVLIVEDEAIQALAMEHALWSAGFSVLVAMNKETLENIAAEHLFAAVVNLHLWPGMSGQDVIRRLRSYAPTLPVVVVTGYEAGSEQAELRGLGGPTERLGKPQFLDDLVPAVGRVIRDRGRGDRERPRRRRDD